MSTAQESRRITSRELGGKSDHDRMEVGGVERTTHQRKDMDVYLSPSSINRC